MLSSYRYVTALIFAAGAILSCSNGPTGMLQSSESLVQQNLSAATAAITLKADAHLCLASTGKDNGAAIVVATCDGSASQAWSSDNNTLRLFGSKCLDVVDGKIQNGSRLQLWDCFEKNTNQLWIWVNNTWVWADKNKCLDLMDGNKTTNSPVQIWDCVGANDNQQWAFDSATNAPSPLQDVNPSGAPTSDANGQVPPAPNATGSIQSSFSPTMCIHHPNATFGGGPSAPYIAQIMPCTNAGEEPLRYSPVGSLIEMTRGLCLTADNTVDPESGRTVVSFQTCRVSDASQQWDFLGTMWRNRKSKACLDLINSGIVPHDRLQVSACSGSVTQGWSTLKTPVLNKFSRVAVASLTAESCATKIKITQSMDSKYFGLLLDEIPDLVDVVRSSANDVCKLFFKSTNNLPPSLSELSLDFSSYEGTSVAAQSNVTINTRYFITRDKDGDRKEISRVLRHEIGHFYDNYILNLDWMNEGMAQYAAIATGFPYENRVKGGSYKDGYSPAAYFLIYLNENYPSFVQNFVADHRPPNATVDFNYFKLKTGKTVDELWDAYQASF